MPREAQSYYLFSGHWGFWGVQVIITTFKYFSFGLLLACGYSGVFRPAYLVWLDILWYHYHVCTFQLQEDLDSKGRPRLPESPDMSIRCSSGTSVVSSTSTLSSKLTSPGQGAPTSNTNTNTNTTQLPNQLQLCLQSWLLQAKELRRQSGTTISWIGLLMKR